MPKVSIIVPVYNTEKYLSKCIQSLVDQTLSDIEILLINDGSTDASPRIMDDFRKLYPQKIRVINKENGGQATARNLGIREATGEYIGFADSDDWADIHMYQAMYEKAVSQDLDLVECKFHFQKEDGTDLKPYVAVRQYNNRKDMFLDPLVSPWNKLVRADILKQMTKCFTEGCIYEDTAFFTKIIPFSEKVEVMEEAFVFHIDRAGSTMNINKSKKVANIFTVMEDSLSFYKEGGFFEEYKDELEYLWVKILLCSSLKRIAVIPDKKMRKEFTENTIEMINAYFPSYRKNKHFKGGMKNIYMKCVNKVTAPIFVGLFRLKG